MDRRRDPIDSPLRTSRTRCDVTRFGTDDECAGTLSSSFAENDYCVSPT